MEIYAEVLNQSGPRSLMYYLVVKNRAFQVGTSVDGQLAVRVVELDNLGIRNDTFLITGSNTQLEQMVSKHGTDALLEFPRVAESVIKDILVNPSINY